MKYDFDLFVIGAGSGGVRAGRLAAQNGQKVGLAEEYRYGGTCVIRGCVPKKLMVYASEFSEIFKDAAGISEDELLVNAKGEPDMCTEILDKILLPLLVNCYEDKHSEITKKNASFANR